MTRSTVGSSPMTKTAGVSGGGNVGSFGSGGCVGRHGAVVRGREPRRAGVRRVGRGGAGPEVGRWWGPRSAGGDRQTGRQGLQLARRSHCIIEE